MRNKISKSIKRLVGLHRDPENKTLKKIYKREKNNYNKLNWLEKTKENERRSKER